MNVRVGCLDPCGWGNVRLRSKPRWATVQGMGVNAVPDRLAMRAKPSGLPVMEQNWNNVLFLHWPFEEATVRRLVPSELELDTFDGAAWVGITPFALTGLTVYPMPPIPGISAFHEINVRTYVQHRGKPGVYFLALDASKLLPSLAARIFYQLPYFAADMEFTEDEQGFRFSSTRSVNPAARFEAKWKRGVRLRAPDTESLAFFLVERYCFFTQAARQVSMTRAYHAPWILEEAELVDYESTLLSAIGLPEPQTAPLTHFSPGVEVQLWPPVSD